MLLFPGDQVRYRIGDQVFTDLPSLLNFYKVFIALGLHWQVFKCNSSSVVYIKQWCGSGLIVSGSTKFDQFGSSPDPGQ